jgi:hypothetical protein
MDKDSEGSDCDLVEATVLQLPGGAEEKHKRSQDVLWPGRDWNRAPPQFKLTSRPAVPNLGVGWGEARGKPICNVSFTAHGDGKE